MHGKNWFMNLFDTVHNETMGRFPCEPSTSISSQKYIVSDKN